MEITSSERRIFLSRVIKFCFNLITSTSYSFRQSCSFFRLLLSRFSSTRIRLTFSNLSRTLFMNSIVRNQSRYRPKKKFPNTFADDPHGFTITYIKFLSYKPVKEARTSITSISDKIYYTILGMTVHFWVLPKKHRSSLISKIKFFSFSIHLDV